MYASFLLLLSIIPQPSVLVGSVDLVELNHFYDEYGKLIFDQVIWYDWVEGVTVIPQQLPMEWRMRDDGTETRVDVGKTKGFSGARYQVRAWRLVKVPEILPVMDHSTGLYRSTWENSEEGTRTVLAKEYRESWTQYDPELVEREFLPKELRLELQKRPARVQSRP